MRQETPAPNETGYEYLTYDAKLKNWNGAILSTSPKVINEVYEYEGEDISEKSIKKFFKKCFGPQNKLRSASKIQSKHSLLHFSEYLLPENIDSLINQDKLSLIKLYRKGCKSCRAMEPGFEVLAFNLKQAKELMQKDGFDNRFHSLVSNLGIKNLENFKNLNLYRLNVANDVR